jgi:hypothetical protein
LAAAVAVIILDVVEALEALEAEAQDMVRLLSEVYQWLELDVKEEILFLDLELLLLEVEEAAQQAKVVHQ